jgi:hypothetical protein
MARRGFKPTAPGRAAPLNERRQPLLLCSLEPTRVAMHAINVYIGIGQTAENIAMHISTSRRSCPASRQTPAEPQRVAPYSGHARPTARPISGALTIVAATSSEQSSVSEPLMGRPIGDRTAATTRLSGIRDRFARWPKNDISVGQCRTRSDCFCADVIPKLSYKACTSDVISLTDRLPSPNSSEVLGS